jgi:CheY-like chemotaxis protein
MLRSVPNAMPTHARSLIVADDDRLVRETLCDLLEPMGFTARLAADGASAIRELGRARCDLLLSDVDMPDLTGFQVLDWARAHPPTPATVLMSARADAELSRAARSAGAIALLAKPVEITALTGLVRSLFPDFPNDNSTPARHGA